jgi:hypothetical protein
VPARTCKATTNADLIILPKKQQLINEQNDCKKYSKQAIVYLMQKSKKASKNTNK